MLIRIGAGDRHFDRIIGIRIGVMVTRRIGNVGGGLGKAAGPFRDRAVGIPGFLGTDGGQVFAEACGFLFGNTGLGGKAESEYSQNISSRNGCGFTERHL
jgi:hypothetical protein